MPLNQLFEHMAWADARVVACLADVVLPEATRLLAHVAAAERVWLLRLRGQDSSRQAIWPDWGLSEVRATTIENAAEFRKLLAESSEEDLARVIEYRNSQGVEFRSTMADILAHVALHGSYHRGQIAAVVRAAGATPVTTDYIIYTREQPAR